MRFSFRGFLEALFLLLPVIVTVPLVVWGGPSVNSARDVVFDAFQRIAPRTYDASLPVRVVDIDEESLRRFGQWPWPRDRLAAVVNTLGDLGASTITLDIVLAEPDRASPEQILERLPDGPEKTALTPMLEGRSNDRALATALLKNRSVIGLVLVNDLPRPLPASKAAFAQAGDAAALFLPSFQGAVPPLPMLSDAASGLGAVNWVPDRDILVRRVPLMFLVGEEIVPSLALETLRITKQASTILVKASNASGVEAFGAPSGISQVKVGDLALATDPDGSVRMHYSGTHAERYIPFWKIVDGLVSREDIEGRTILIGSSAASLSDLRSTPLHSSVPGVEIHAEILEQMLSGVQLIRPDFAPGVEILLLLIGALIAGMLARTAGPIPAAGAIALLFPAMMGLSWVAFSRLDYLIDPVMPMLTVLGTYIAATLLVYRQSDGEKRQIRAAFSHYVAADVVRAIAADPSRLKLGGETKPLTVLFSDLRDFTARSEDMPAENVIRFLNLMHTPLTAAVLAERGTIDKYIGDGLMAFWNAPLDVVDHVDCACRTAIAMQRCMSDVEATLAREIGPDIVAHGPLRLGIGISTGMAFVGNMGSSLRFDYSTVGDTVNTAARIEPLTRIYDVPIIVSHAVAAVARGFVFLPIDTVRLKGKARPTRIYALHAERSQLTEAFTAFQAEHEEALEAVKGRELRARRLVAAIRSHPEAGPFQGVYDAWDREITTRESLTLDPMDISVKG